MFDYHNDNRVDKINEVESSNCSGGWGQHRDSEKGGVKTHRPTGCETLLSSAPVTPIVHGRPGKGKGAMKARKIASDTANPVY